MSMIQLFILVAVIGTIFTISTLYLKHQLKTDKKETVCTVMVTSLFYMIIYIAALILIFIKRGEF